MLEGFQVDVLNIAILVGSLGRFEAFCVEVCECKVMVRNLPSISHFVENSSNVILVKTIYRLCTFYILADLHIIHVLFLSLFGTRECIIFV